VLSWDSILLSAALTGVAGLLGSAPFERPWEPRRLAYLALSAAAGPILWHLLTRAATPSALTAEWTEPVFPVSRSDAGVSLTTFATTAMVLGLGPDRRLAAGRVLTLALGCALAAFGLAVYLS
jgi:hypothetical protein